MRRWIRKFAHNQANKQRTDREQFKNWGHSNPLWIVGGAGQLHIIGTWLNDLWHSYLEVIWNTFKKSKQHKYTNSQLNWPKNEDSIRNIVCSPFFCSPNFCTANFCSLIFLCLTKPHPRIIFEGLGISLDSYFDPLFRI